jgi:fucose permease
VIIHANGIRHYGIGYGVVSLIFVGNALGFITAAVFIDTLRDRFGRAKSLAISQAVMTACYVPVVVGAPFAAIVICFFLAGFGMSVNLALSNTFCGRLRNGTTVLGAVHGSYGIGGTLGPLIATALVTQAGASWNHYYFLPLGLAIFNAGFAAWSYWNFESDSGHAPLITSEDSRSPSATGFYAMFSAIASRVVLLGAMFIFAYQGAEVSISGWVISFLITERDGNPSSVGYVTSGFWAGITLGRFLLSGPAHRVGEKAFVYAAVVGAAVFELLVWLIPNVIGNAVAVSIVGLLLGPVYPCAVAVFMKCLSRREGLRAMSIISAFGSSGGAVAPFTTGILAQAAGTFVLHPIAIGLFAVMLVCWYGLPRPHKREE